MTSMKPWCIAVLAFTGLLSAPARSQTLRLGLLAEKTVQLRIEAGLFASWETKQEWSFGVMAQTEASWASEESRRRRYGLTIGIPIVRSEKMTLLTRGRFFVIDNQFVAFIPAVETSVRLWPGTRAFIGSSVRMRQPSCYGGVAIAIIK